MLLRRHHKIINKEVKETDTVKENLEKLTVKELRELASVSNIEGYSKMKKEELIQAIEDI